MENIITVTKRNGETLTPKGKRELLAFSSRLLVPCKVEENTDDFKIKYDVSELVLFFDKKKKSLLDKYRFLYNCKDLKKLICDFEINLDPNNIYVDLNLSPKILNRDLGEVFEESFVAQYKALIASILYPRKKYEDYYKGGFDLYKKRKKLKEISQKQTVDEIAEMLLELYKKETEHINKTKKLVGKKGYRVLQVLVPLFVVVALSSGALAYYLFYLTLPYKESLIDANNSYIYTDYLSVQSELSDMNIENIPYETKYILARSYVVTESLNSDQKENILRILTPQTDELYFNYWIELGRLNFDMAIDAAQRLGDNQLLLLSYIKYETFLETDTTTLTGEQKAQTLSEIADEIEKLSKQLNPET